MKTFAKTLLAAAGAVMLAGAAQAGQLDNNDVVTDERGQVVVNTFGNCVRTKWEGGHSGCYDMSKEFEAKGKDDRLIVSLSIEELLDFLTYRAYN